MAASTGLVRYVSITSGDAPGQLANTESRGSSTVVRVASGSRVNEITPANSNATHIAHTTAGRCVAKRITPLAPYYG